MTTARRNFMFGLASPASAYVNDGSAKFVNGSILFTELSDARVPSSITSLRTAGHHIPGVGGATYVRTYRKAATPYRVLSADGGSWEISELQLTPQMFGARGSGALDDTNACQDWLNALQDLNIQGYVPAGTYLVSALRATDVTTLSINGAGPAVTRFKRLSASCSRNYTRLMLFRNRGGSSARLNLANFSIDGNARNNPLLDIRDPWSLQHCSEIAVIPRGSLGFDEVRIHDIRGFDPVADLISLTGNDRQSYRTIMVSRISSNGRTRERSDVNILASWDQATLSDLAVDCIEVETNKPGIDSALSHSLTVSNANCRTYCSIYAKGSRLSARRPKLSVTGLTVGSFFTFGEMDGEITNLHATLTQPCRLLNGRWQFHGGRIIVGHQWTKSSGLSAAIFWNSGSGVESLLFDGTVFDSESNRASVTHFVRENGSNRPEVDEICFRNVQFRSRSIKAALLRNGPYRWEHVRHYYDGPGGSIDCSNGWTTPDVKNEWRIYNNELFSSRSYIIQLPDDNVDVPGHLWFSGNRVSGATRVILNLHPELVGPPHGADSKFIFGELDNGNRYSAGMCGVIYQGQQFVCVGSPPGEPLCYIATSTGAVGAVAWKAKGEYLVGDVVRRGSDVLICLVSGFSGRSDDFLRGRQGLFRDGAVVWRKIPESQVVVQQNVTSAPDVVRSR